MLTRTAPGGAVCAVALVAASNAHIVLTKVTRFIEPPADYESGEGGMARLIRPEKPIIVNGLLRGDIQGTMTVRSIDGAPAVPHAFVARTRTK